MPAKMKTVMDPRLLRKEYLNKSGFDILVEPDWNFRNYVLGAGITFMLPGGKDKILLPDGERLIVSHEYLILTGLDKKGVPLPKGTPLNILISFGNNIGTGATLPSIPEYDREWAKKGRY